MEVKKITTRCCIVGGGPAGIMLGFLLARSGIETTVLEKWPDFFRDFRGDTIHPATLELLYQLGLLDEFLKLPHNETHQLTADIGGHKVTMADFSHLKVHCPFVAFVPQWNFLKFISQHAEQYSNFHLLMQTEAEDILTENGHVIGVRAKNDQESFEIYAELVVGADGRHSTMREKSGLTVQTLSAPMDVLWFRMSRKETDPKQTLGRVDLGCIIIMIERGDYWQCGYLIRKGDFDSIRNQGLESFRHSLVEVVPWLVDRAHEIESWDQVKLLTVSVDRLKQWYHPGLLCIGDAAHTMSPIGGVGINLAVQDAVAAANILVPAFLTGKITEHDLAAVQKRREPATKLIQCIQVFIQNNVIAKVLGNPIHPKLPFPLKLLQWFPYLRRIPAHIIGMGFRPERIRTVPIDQK